MSQFESSTFESLQSAFAAGLDTNSIPSECQLEHPQSLIAQSRNGMTSISHPIAQTTSEEAKGTAYLLGHEASLPPVVRMPDDVIREIFLACMPEDRNCAMRASEAPLLLGRVCSAWRSIAYSTPRLWSKLHVDAPRTPGPLGTRGRWEVYRRKWAVRADVIRTWLGRSGEVPLSLSFKTFDDADGSPHGSAHIEPLMSLARRWADVDFKVNRDELARLAEIQVGDVPKLERVKVTTVDSLWVNDLSAAALLQAQTAVPMPPVEAGTHQLWAKLQILGSAVCFIEVAFPDCHYCGWRFGSSICFG
ncbi:unnamed protein product [Mycena citricolor]|uniref:F-box domain-containing protein n=1 Tax=Mycena citricolor TaxID=2018698 RepID=A0AAD2H1T1_9AGAR|nr:unnamed protein product [Mycena citricolor]CAK5282591.1 unnamed protein product [Mycena citricolor]CAK5282602.1 unnamed protein product [Mycena citricolor]